MAWNRSFLPVDLLSHPWCQRRLQAKSADTEPAAYHHSCQPNQQEPHWRQKARNLTACRTRERKLLSLHSSVYLVMEVAMNARWRGSCETEDIKANSKETGSVTQEAAHRSHLKAQKWELSVTMPADATKWSQQVRHSGHIHDNFIVDHGAAGSTVATGTGLSLRLWTVPHSMSWMGQEAGPMSQV